MVTAAEVVSQAYQARKEGDLPLARELYAEGARIYREQNDTLACAHALRHIADIHQQEKNAAEAKPLYVEALELYRSNLNTKLLDLANTVRPFALLVEQEGDFDQARRLWEEAKSLYGSLRIEPGVTESARHLTRLQPS